MFYLWAETVRTFTKPPPPSSPPPAAVASSSLNHPAHAQPLLISHSDTPGVVNGGHIEMGLRWGFYPLLLPALSLYYDEALLPVSLTDSKPHVRGKKKKMRQFFFLKFLPLKKYNWQHIKIISPKVSCLYFALAPVFKNKFGSSWRPLLPPFHVSLSPTPSVFWQRYTRLIFWPGNTFRTPLHLTPLINRWPTTEPGPWPCHSLARLIGFHLSLQRKGSDYKQINRVGLHGGGPAGARCLKTLWQEGRLRVRESGGLENGEFEGQVVYCRDAARMMEVAASRVWLGVFKS